MKKILSFIVLGGFVIAAVATQDGDSSSSQDNPQQEQVVPNENSSEQMDTKEAEPETPPEAEPEYSNDGDDAVKVDESSDYANENE